MSDKFQPDSGSTGEWRARTGTHTQIDTVKLRELDGAELSTETVTGTDPYNTTAARRPVLGTSTRRSLDDMRKLSETIKKSRNQRQ